MHDANNSSYSDLMYSRCPENFVQKVWSSHRCGFVFLAARRSRQWIEYPIDVKDLSGLREWFSRYVPAECDLYFCPNVFGQPKRQALFALSTPFAWCDIDEGNPGMFAPQPSIVLETSPSRYQGIWCFDNHVEAAQAEAVSKYLAYSFGGDRNGWSVTKMLRLPFTINHKERYGKPSVNLLRYSDASLLKWPEVKQIKKSVKKIPSLRSNGSVDDVLRRLASKVDRRYLPLVRRKSAPLEGEDKSLCIWLIVAALYKADGTHDDIATVLRHHPYFLAKHGENDHALEKEICRIVAKLDAERKC